MNSGCDFHAYSSSWTNPTLSPHVCAAADEGQTHYLLHKRMMSLYAGENSCGYGNDDKN